MPAMRPPHDTQLVVGLMVVLSGAAGGVGYVAMWRWLGGVRRLTPSAPEPTCQGQMVADVACLLDHR